jgi:hypothetical protein
VTALAGNELLAAARTDYASRLKDLQAAFEAKGGAAATDAYWNEKREQRWATMRWVHQKALSLPPKTPEASALTKEIQALWTPPAGAKAWYEANERMYAKCIELIALRSQPEQDQTAFEVQFGKLEKTFNAAAAVNDNTEPTKTAKTTFDQTFSALKARRDGNEPTRFTDCKAQLPTLLAQARAVLDKQIAALKSTAAGIKAVAPANDDEKRDKAGQAATALTGDPIILEQLGVDEKLDLLDAMRARPPARPMPSPPNPPGLVDPNDYDLMLKCRKAQRALYKATPLDDKFVAKDKENRAKMIDALKLKKKELQGAQDGWKAMTPDQKKATFESVIEDQCKAFGFEKATLVVEDFGPANSSNGAFDPVTNTIRVNSGAPACDDFELAMDLILHENTHNYQKQLALRLDATDPTKKLTDPSDPLYTQARLFKANNAIGGYVPPGEEYEAYEKQPTEAHAWIGGSQAARMVMEMLATQ